jgi:hypothetical protein
VAKEWHVRIECGVVWCDSAARHAVVFTTGYCDARFSALVRARWRDAGVRERLPQYSFTPACGNLKVLRIELASTIYSFIWSEYARATPRL